LNFSAVSSFHGQTALHKIFGSAGTAIPSSQELERVKENPSRPSFCFVNHLTLEEIFAGAESRAHRDAAILKTCHECGYTQAQVATATSLHHLMASKIIRIMG
jgi:hypothetical protein